MADVELARSRLVSQGLLGRLHPTPAAAAVHMGAMQGQDLIGVIASVALRTQEGAVNAVLEAFNSAALVRGYPMRGTVFLMAATDAAWITELCAAPALRASEARRHYRDISETQMAQAREIAVTALTGNTLSRRELFHLWDQAGLTSAGGRGYHFLSYMIAQGTLIYGPWNGQDQDVALAASWLPAASGLEGRFNGERQAAIAELLRRYLVSHGPASVRDFSWWSKLPLREIRAALADIEADLETDKERYWRPGLLKEVAEVGRAIHTPLLLPGFDEYILGYQDRLFAMTGEQHQRLVPGNNGVFKRSVVVGGQVCGTWTRAGSPGRRTLAVDEFRALGPATRARLNTAFRRFPFAAP